MNERTMQIDHVHLTELIRNPVIVKIVNILDKASLSILELLEYNLERREINYALSEGIIAIDKRMLPSSLSHLNPPTMMRDVNILLSGYYYFYNFLNSKVGLTELGLYVLDSIKGEPIRFELPVDHGNQFDLSSFNPPSIP